MENEKANPAVLDIRYGIRVYRVFYRDEFILPELVPVDILCKIIGCLLILSSGIVVAALLLS